MDRVIHHRGEVSPETKKKIKEILKKMNYHPNIMASTLASKKYHVFALLFPKPISKESYWNKPLIGVQKAMTELTTYGVKILIYQFSQNDPDSFRIEAEEILKNPPEGVVLAPYFSRETEDIVTKLGKLKIPYVFIDSNLKGCPKLSYIGQNSFQSGALTAKLLDFSLPGTANILIVHFGQERDNLNHLKQREKGFYKYFKENDPRGIKKLTTLEIENLSEDNYFPILDKTFKKIKKIDGIFVTNSQAYRIGDYLKKNGIRKGKIKIIGHDLIKRNVEYLENNVIDFLICQHPEEQGYQSVETLFRYLIQKENVPAENYTPIDIITKENYKFYKELNLINYYGINQF